MEGQSSGQATMNASQWQVRMLVMVSYHCVPQNDHFFRIIYHVNITASDE